MSLAKAITVIPAAKKFSEISSSTWTTKKRVAAYARVSTDNEEQLSSFEAQRNYYAQYIRSKSEWTFVEVYADEGISATSTKKRDGFNRMVNDALDGKIDLIITKSVSRFARNTVDTLTTVRKLKEQEVEVYFEKENIYTLDSKGELLITIMSSLAQEESRSISENVTWGQRKRFAEGKVNLPYGQFLGYEKGEDNLPKIVEKEAQVVRKIYRLFLEGKTPSGIAKILTDEKIPSPGGKEKWPVSTVTSILTNEKYKGDAILQKAFTVDFLTKKKKKNEGEIPMYYVENSHPSIVSSDVFDQVQYELKIRKKHNGYKTGVSCFSGRIKCGQCGCYYGSKVWHSNSKYRRVIWQCNHKYQDEEKCSTPHIYEENLKKAFIEELNKILLNQDKVISDLRLISHEIFDSNKLIEKELYLKNELTIVENLIEKCIKDNALVACDQNEYSIRYNELLKRHENKKSELNRLVQQRADASTKKRSLEELVRRIEEQEIILTSFDEELWISLVDSVVIQPSGEMLFNFQGKIF
ncbi:recombinase family protein [Youngiibacter multivorans]|uniref:DNA invertase Pin-like site-specific DNA recombinase n=1 Tax=Youngiibacter multivorans TaxID=937251 RepID=A0ABS4G7W2_9CLOT|nr:recombinase family protein [Youngiibacter multivorans]MBP1920647.1 DNA invertase Pin-like site-specific DNA recombinase [Youngiibacter multivorans]